MGHTSITTTRNYIDSLVDEERDAIKDALMPDLGDEFNPPEQEVEINPRPPKEIIMSVKCKGLSLNSIDAVGYSPFDLLFLLVGRGLQSIEFIKH